MLVHVTNVSGESDQLFCVEFQVLLARCTLHSHTCDKICVEVEVEEHLECGCECKVKRRHCNSKQVSE